MYLNANDIIKIDNELSDVCGALVAGVPVFYRDPVDGWVETKQVSVFRNREDYSIGQIPGEL